MTDNNNYETPAKGSENWNEPLNNNFERLDIDVEVRDSEANIQEYIPKVGAKFFAVDTERVFLGDGTTWNQLATSGRAPTFDAVTIKSQSNMVYAANFPGADLSEKVMNALDALPNGYGRVIVTPKDDGTPWAWTGTVRRDVSDYGVDIDFISNVHINVDVDGWALDFVGGTEAWNNPVDTVTLSGGYWRFNDAADPDGWLRITDMYGADISPTAVTKIRNSRDDAVGVQIRNVNHFSEGTYLHHFQFREVDIGVDHVPASVSGGSGTESFHNERMDQVHIDGLEQIGVRFQNGCQLAASSFSDVAIWPSGSSVVAWVLDCEPDGCAIERPKIESPSSVDLTAFKIRNSAWKPMRVYDPMMTGVDTKVDTPGDGQYIVIYNDENEPNIVKDRGFDRTVFSIADGAFVFDGNRLENVAEGTSSSDPTADTPDGWLEITDSSGATKRVPYYQ